MQKCERCNLEVKGDKYCPLCGKFVNGVSVEREYPLNIVKKINKRYVLRVIFGLLLMLNFLAVALELIITKRFYYGWQIIVPSVLVLICVYFPLKKNWGIFGACPFAILAVSGYVIFLENFTHSVGWGVNYVVPLFLLGVELSGFLILVISKFEKVDVFLPILICFIVSLGIFLYVYLKKFIYWPATVALLFGFAVMFTIFVVKNRRAKKSLQKSFHV